MQARYYDPVIGRFLSIDPVGFTPDQLGHYRGLLRLFFIHWMKIFAARTTCEVFNRYAYVGNDPVNAVDPDGMAPDDRFDTIDEAAIDLVDYAARETARTGDNRERGGDIKKDADTGEYYYDNIQVGDNDSVDVAIGPSTEAIVHTHPPSEDAGRGLADVRSDRANNGKISEGDRKIVREANRELGRKIPTYVGTADGSVTRFDPDTNYRKGTQVAQRGTVDFEEE